jgi:hypothetical protein
MAMQSHSALPIKEFLAKNNIPLVYHSSHHILHGAFFFS